MVGMAVVVGLMVHGSQCNVSNAKIAKGRRDV